MLAVLVGLPVRVMMPREQRQQMPFGVVDLGMVGAALRRLEGLGDIKGKVDRHQRVEGECQEAEPRGPDPAPPRPQSGPVAPAQGALICKRP